MICTDSRAAQTSTRAFSAILALLINCVLSSVSINFNATLVERYGTNSRGSGEKTRPPPPSPSRPVPCGVQEFVPHFLSGKNVLTIFCGRV